jgi:hypothetical protein
MRCKTTTGDWRRELIPTTKHRSQASSLSFALGKSDSFGCSCYSSCFKGSRQRERRGFGKVSNTRNMSRTAAIDVLFSLILAVVFDFMYFRFRPSKTK